MRELGERLARLRELERANAPGVLATIVRVEGSSYRREGARLLIEPDGRLTGVLSGGCLERDIVALAAETLALGAPRTQLYDLTADEEAIWGTGTGCAGRVTLLLEPLDRPRRQAEIAILETILETRRELRIATLFHSETPGGESLALAGDRIVVSIEGAAPEAARRAPAFANTHASESSSTPGFAPPGAEGASDSSNHATGAMRDETRTPSPTPATNEPTSAPPSVLSFYGSFFRAPSTKPTLDLLDSLAPGEARAVELATESGAASLLVESLLPPIHLLVIGAERDVPALARLGAELGWAVTVADPRPSAEAAARFGPEVCYLGAPPRALAAAGVELSARTAILLATHRYLDDLAYLAEIGAAPVGYLGLLGPVRRRERLLGDLARLDAGLAARIRARLSGPAGLDLGGRAPEEVALSVVAEIQAALGRRAGGRLTAKIPGRNP